jgi:hypothetical protein
LKWGGVIAAGLLVAWAAYMLLSDSVPPVCHDEVTSSETAAKPADLVVSVCEPIGVTDPRALLFLLVVFLLLMPFFSEIEVAGLFRVKKQVEEAEKDVAGLRDTVRTAEAQVATLMASVAATASSQSSSESKVEYHHHDHRGAESGEVQQLAAGGSDEVDTSVGAYAQAAFNAGLVGLESLLVMRTPEAMLYFTVSDSGVYELSQRAGAELPDAVLNHALDLVNTDQLSSFADTVGDYLVVTGPAIEPGFTVIGAVAAVFAGATMPEQSELRALFADVSTVAGAYGRLLADLLGETSRVLPSSVDGEGGP